MNTGAKTLRACVIQAVIAACLMMPAAPAGADVTVLSDADAGLTVSVDGAKGTYEIATRDPAWTFGGSIGKPLDDLVEKAGSDKVGPFQEMRFGWTGDGPTTGGIRIYPGRSVVLFTMTLLEPAGKLARPFPNLTTVPGDLHRFSYQPEVFAPHTFSLTECGSPWLLFDDRASACIISPASNFMIARMTGDGRTSITSGFNGGLSNLPGGFTHQTLLVLANGINRCWDTWGRALTDLQGKTRPANDADVGLKYLGYWTDAGAHYYYNFDLDKGCEGTLLALCEHYRKRGIPARYLQLDSWWYSKSFTDPQGYEPKNPKPKNPKLPPGRWNRYGGLLEYAAHPDLFPDGLAAFQKKIRLPLITHNRWIDRKSPYHEAYRISGIGAVDPKWWDDIMSHLAAAGVVTYEQDWLNYIYNCSPEMGQTVDVGNAFTDNMARAAGQRGMTLQYCMALPRHFLQGTRYDNLTTMRVSGDRLERTRWNNLFYTSRLARAVGVWPWADVLRSRETDNMLLQALSAGMVGPGDEIGTEDTENIFRAVRRDGVIVKPDVPIVPTDATFIADARSERRPLVAATYTDHGTERALYVFAFARKQDKTADVRFAPSSLGVDETAYIYNFMTGAGKTVDAGAAFNDTLGDEGWAYYIVAPIGESGISFLGDAGKFVSRGKQRIAAVSDEPGTLTAVVTFAQGETSVTLHGYAASKPEVATRGGRVDKLVFDARARRFRVRIAPADDAVRTESQPGGMGQARVAVKLTAGAAQDKPQARGPAVGPARPHRPDASKPGLLDWQGRL